MWDDGSPQGTGVLYRMASMEAARYLSWPDKFRLELTLAEDVGIDGCFVCNVALR